MISSKQIAKALLDSLKRGVDPILLADLLVDKLVKSSQKAQVKHILFYLEEYGKKEKIETVFHVESATEMSPLSLEKLQELFGAVGSTVETNVRRDLVGGFRLKYGDLSYDATLKTRLGKLKEALN